MKNEQEKTPKHIKKISKALREIYSAKVDI